MLSDILLAMIQRTSEQNLLNYLKSQNAATLKKILQCFVICQYHDDQLSEIVDSVVNNVDDKSDDCNQMKLYNTNNLDENEKKILSMFENKFELCFSKTKPFILDVIPLIFSYFCYWEVFKCLALIDKQWNTASKTYRTISYYHGNVFLMKDDFKRIKDIGCIDYRREEDGKFVKAINCEYTCASSKIILKHPSNIVNYKSGLFDPCKYSNIMAYCNSITNQKFIKNECLLNMKNELIQGKIMDIRLKDCYLIYNEIKYFQIRISEWMCGIIYDLFFLHNNNNGSKKNDVEKQPYTSQIPLIVDITEWCKIKCKNDEPDTIYHNLYSYDYENKQFIKIEKNILNHELILFQYWVHGDFINEISPFQSHSSLEEQQKMRKVLPIVQTCCKYNENEKVINSDILKLNLIQQ